MQGGLRLVAKLADTHTHCLISPLWPMFGLAVNSVKEWNTGLEVWRSYRQCLLYASKNTSFWLRSGIFVKSISNCPDP